MAPGAASARYRVGRLELQIDERRLLSGGQAVPLGRHAFDVLVAFVEQGNRLVTKDKLFARVWGKMVVEENILSAQVSALRKVLGSQAVDAGSGQAPC